MTTFHDTEPTNAQISDLPLNDGQDALFALPAENSTRAESVAMPNGLTENSLGETAIAPDLPTKPTIRYTPPPATQTKNKRPLYIGTGVGVVGLAATIFALNSGTDSTNAKNSAPIVPLTPETVNNIGVVPEGSGINTEANTIVITPTKETITTPESSTLQTEYEQTLTLEQMNAMSIEDFAKLDYGNRAAFLYMNLPNIDPIYPEEGFDPTIIPGYVWHGTILAASGNDATAGAKYVSSLYYDVIDKNTGAIDTQYQHIIDQIFDNNTNQARLDSVFVYKSNGEKQTGSYKDYKNVDYTNISYVTKWQSTGEIIAEQTAQVFEVHVKLADGRYISMFPSGYQVSGLGQATVPGSSF